MDRMKEEANGRFYSNYTYWKLRVVAAVSQSGNNFITPCIQLHGASVL
jgi:hypothetical protein